LRPWQKRARRKWEAKLDEAKDKEKSIKEALRSLRGAANNQGQGQGQAQGGLVTGGGLMLPNYANRSGLGVVPVAQQPGYAIDLPIVFDATGTEQALISVASTDVAGDIEVLSGSTKQYTYLDLKVLKFKVNVMIKPLGINTSSPILSALYDNSAQVHVLLTSLNVDGGYDLVPDTQVLDLNGPFGTNNSGEFQGIRFNDLIYANGRAKFVGGLQLGFDADQAYQISVRAAVSAEIIRDYRREAPVR
ncbi:MAG: hypothetical protein NTV51_03685, partial [Verrucomicrobia bacterium]|nr:hypothetical protein [Verrucomicrobiota bacterium]